MEQKPELSFMGRYAEFLEKKLTDPTDTDDFRATDMDPVSMEFFASKEAVGTKITHVEFTFLYKTILNEFMGQLKANKDPKAFQNPYILKHLTKNLGPVLIQKNIATCMTAGKNIQDAYLLALGAAKFWQENPEFIEMLIESCWNDATIKVIQEAIADFVEAQSSQY